MPYSVKQHRADLRADALLDSWARSLGHIDSITSDHPVVPVPTESQALLEGEVFHAMEVLYFSTGDERIRKLNLPGALEVTRLRAETERLLLDTAPHGVALTLGRTLFSWQESGPGTPVHSAGLRLRSVAFGVEVYRPGLPGSVQIGGVRLDEVIAEHRTVCPDGRCIAESSPREVTAAEAEHGYHPTREFALALSAMVRRLGILRRAGADSIDSWALLLPRPDEAVAVEAWFPQLDPALRESIIEDLSSEHLSPHWSIEPWLGRSGEPIESYFRIRSAGNHADIQLRLIDRSRVDREYAKLREARQ